MSYEDCCGFFVDKLKQWNASGPVEPYITARDVDGIYEEFRLDNAVKTAVCNYVKQVAQERKRAIVFDILMAVGALPPFNISKFAIDILISAVLQACGYERESNDFLKYVLIGSGILALVGIGYSIWKSQEPKKRRKQN